MSPKHFTLHWRGETLRGELRLYPHIGNPAIQLYDSDGLPHTTASINLPYSLPEGLIVIRTSQDNSLLIALETAGIVARTGQTVPVGYACAHLCRVLI